MRRDPKELAELFIERCSKRVNGYVGSSFMTNTEYPEVIRLNAVKLSQTIVHDLIDSSEGEEKQYYKEVLKHL